MRCKLVFFFFLLIMSSCKKVNNGPDRLTVDLSIANTLTLKTVTLGNKIISQVKCIEPGTCYEFSDLEIKQINPSNLK